MEVTGPVLTCTPLHSAWGPRDSQDHGAPASAVHRSAPPISPALTIGWPIASRHTMPSVVSVAFILEIAVEEPQTARDDGGKSQIGQEIGQITPPEVRRTPLAGNESVHRRPPQLKGCATQILHATSVADAMWLVRYNLGICTTTNRHDRQEIGLVTINGRSRVWSPRCRDARAAQSRRSHRRNRANSRPAIPLP